MSYSDRLSRSKSRMINVDGDKGIYINLRWDDYGKVYTVGVYKARSQDHTILFTPLTGEVLNLMSATRFSAKQLDSLNASLLENPRVLAAIDNVERNAPMP